MVQLLIPTYLLLSGNNSYLFLWFLFYYDKICVTISLSSLFIVCYVNIVHTCLYNCTTMIFALEFDCLEGYTRRGTNNISEMLIVQN